MHSNFSISIQEQKLNIFPEETVFIENKSAKAHKCSGNCKNCACRKGKNKKNMPASNG